MRRLLPDEALNSDAQRGSELAFGGSVHVGRVEAQLDVRLVAQHRLVGELDADRIGRFRALAQQVLVETGTCGRGPWSRRPSGSRVKRLGIRCLVEQFCS